MKKPTTSKYRGRTDRIPPLSSEESIEERERLLSALVGSTTVKSQTQTMTTTPKQYEHTFTTEINEQARIAATILVPLLSVLEKNGLIRRFKLLSKENQLTAIEVVFEVKNWTENLELQEFTTVTSEIPTDNSGNYDKDA